jgi:hypothetical protein
MKVALGLGNSDKYAPMGRRPLGDIITMHYLTLAVLLLYRYLHDLIRRPQGPVRCPVGVNRWSRHLELLLAAPGSAVGRVLLLSWTDTFVLPHLLPPDCAGVLLLGHNQQHGRFRGMVRLPSHTLAPFHAIRFVGPGMHTVTARQEWLPESLVSAMERLPAGSLTRWSRTMGALGEATWQRLTGLHYAIVGVGRTGSLLAHHLTRQGVRHLTLIDPDHIELHNLGEMLLGTEADLGRPKVEVVRGSLLPLAPQGSEVVSVPTSITRLQALHAAQACDVLVSGVDHDSARLAVTAIATLFCKPLLDIATGVHGHGPARQIGADIRLVLPGRCLLCFGGLRNPEEARQVLASAEAERAFYAQRNWQRERAGSLASLNLSAVGLALRFLEDLIDERIQDSAWEHLEFDASGNPSVSHPPVPPETDHYPCPLCRLTGWGEEGLPRVVELLRQNHFWDQVTHWHSHDTTQQVE